MTDIVHIIITAAKYTPVYDQPQNTQLFIANSHLRRPLNSTQLIIHF